MKQEWRESGEGQAAAQAGVAPGQRCGGSMLWQHINASTIHGCAGPCLEQQRCVGTIFGVEGGPPQSFGSAHFSGIVCGGEVCGGGGEGRGADACDTGVLRLLAARGWHAEASARALAGASSSLIHQGLQPGIGQALAWLSWSGLQPGGHHSVP